jgi:hypothetical protein
MAYTDPPDFSAFDTLTAEQLDILSQDLEALHEGTGFEEGAITAATLAPSAITLGYAQKVADQGSIISTTGAQITGLSSTVDIPEGGRRVKITAFCHNTSNNGDRTNILQIWEGTVGSGTQLASSLAKNRDATDSTGFMMCMAVHTPSAGSKTYNIGMAVDADVGVLHASASNPAFILVEAI